MGKKTTNAGDASALALIVEDNTQHRDALFECLNTSSFRLRVAPPYSGPFKVGDVVQWIDEHLSAEQSESLDHIIPVLDLSWGAHSQANLPNWLRDEFGDKVDLAFISLLLCPEHLQEDVAPISLPEGLRLLSMLNEQARLKDRLRPIVVSTFGGSLRHLTEHLGAYRTVQKYPLLKRFFPHHSHLETEVLKWMYQTRIDRAFCELLRALRSTTPAHYQYQPTRRNAVELSLTFDGLDGDTQRMMRSAFRDLDHRDPRGAESPDEDARLPLDPVALRLDIESCFRSLFNYPERKALHLAKRSIESISDDRIPLVGHSKSTVHIRRCISRIAPFDRKDVLILGESGTGKALVAKSLHDLSPRADRPFIIVDCGALPEHLLESELFGHVKGAFTGAHADRRGRIAEAEGGTVFIDEVGEATTQIQLRLNRLMQDREYQRVGDNNVHLANVRLVFATHRRLKELVGDGTLREDFFYRLPRVVIPMQPLREHREDIPDLVDHFLKNACQRFNRTVTLSVDARTYLASSSWPGNVRHLQETIEAFVVVFDEESDQRDAEVLRDLIEQGVFSSNVSDITTRLPTTDLSELQRLAFIQALKEAGGSHKKALESLGIPRSTYWKRLKEYEETRSAS